MQIHILKTEDIPDITDEIEVVANWYEVGIVTDSGGFVEGDHMLLEGEPEAFMRWAGGHEIWVGDGSPMAQKFHKEVMKEEGEDEVRKAIKDSHQSVEDYDVFIDKVRDWSKDLINSIPASTVMSATIASKNIPTEFQKKSYEYDCPKNHTGFKIGERVYHLRLGITMLIINKFETGYFARFIDSSGRRTMGVKEEEIGAVFPKCSRGCKFIETYGASECDSMCPDRDPK